MNSGLTTIENEAFRNCTGLVEISLPGSLETVSEYAFRGGKSLTAKQIDLDSLLHPADTMKGITWKPSSAKIASVDKNGCIQRRNIISRIL